MSRFITKTVELVFAILLFLILIAMGVSLAETVLSGLVAVVVGVILVSLVFLALYFGKKFIRDYGLKLYRFLSGVDFWKLAVILGLFSAISKIFFVFLFDNNADLHPDMAMYRSFAEQYASNGRIIEYTDYAYRHAYTAIYGLLLSPFANLFGSDTKVFTVVLSLLHSISIVLLFDIAKKYVGKEVPFVVLMLYAVLPLGLFQTQLLTHENGLLFFHILALWLFLKVFETQQREIVRVGYLILSSCVLSIGKSINAAGQVFFISFGIYAIAHLLFKPTLKKTANAIGVVVVLALVFVGSSNIVTTVKNNTIEGSETFSSDERKVSYGWSIYLGMNYETSGVINEADHDTYYKYMGMQDVEEARQYQKDIIVERAQTYIESPYKIPIHFFNKIKKLWGMPTLPFAYELGNDVNDYVMHGSGGVLYKGIVLINSGMLLILYAFTFIGVLIEFRKKQQTICPMHHCAMAVIGVTVALLMFEVTPKYVSHLSVMIFMVCAFVLKNALNISKMDSSN